MNDTKSLDKIHLNSAQSDKFCSLYIKLNICIININLCELNLRKKKHEDSGNLIISTMNFETLKTWSCPL